MALSQSQKVDFLLKKIGYTASKTGFSQDGGLGASKKAGFAEAIPSPLKIADSSVWSESENIPGTPPTSTSTYVGVYTGANAIRMTVDTTVANERAFVARSTWSDQSSANMQNWIDTQYGTGYLVKVWMGNPTGVSTALPAGGGTLGSNNTWFFDYASGVLAFHDTNAPTGISTDNIYIEGYRYVGATGVPSPGDDFSFQDLTVTRNLSVTGLSTFTGLVDINGGGQANTFKVEDLTDNRIVIAGTGGELEDSANLTFNGTVLALTGNQTVSGTLDVDGQAIFDDITVSAASTFTGISTFNSNVFVEATTDTNQLHVSGVSTFSGNINLPDSVSAVFGTDDDGSIKHTGTNLQIFETTGNIQITNYANDKDVVISSDDGSGGTASYFTADGSTGKASLSYYGTTKLTTDSVGVDITGTVTDDGARHDGDVYFIGQTSGRNAVWDMSDDAFEFADNAKANFGDSADLQLYHSGSNSNVYHTGTGNLNILSSTGDIALVVGGSNEVMLRAKPNAQTELYFNNNLKLETNNTGVVVTGIVSATTFSGNATTATDLAINGTNQIVYQSANNNSAILPVGSAGQILQSNGSGSAPQWVTSAPAGAIEGISVRDEGSIVGSANSISQLNFVGSVVTADAATLAGIATVTINAIAGLGVSEGSGSKATGATGLDFVGPLVGVDAASNTGISTVRVEGLSIKDEGSTVGTAGSITTINFVGTGIAAAVSGNTATVTSSGASTDDIVALAIALG